nr:hypothetical protein [Tanacetum cinerariifolium]
MGRDTIQLENAVSTISQEYLLEFTSEYGIPESLHPELPDPKDPIVEFPEGKVGVYTKFFEFANFRIPISQFLFDILGRYQIRLSQLSVIGWMSFSKRPMENTPRCYTKPLDSLKNWNNRYFWVDEKVFLTVVDWRTNAPKDEMSSADSYSAMAVATYGLFNLISASSPTKMKIETRPRAAHEVPLLTAIANRVIDMGDTAMASGSSGTPAAIEKSPLDFTDEDPPQVITKRDDEATAEVIPESGLGKEVAAMGPVVNLRRRKRGNEQANVLPKILRKDHVTSRPSQSTLTGKSLAAMGIEADSTGFASATQETFMNAKGVSDPDPLSYAEPRPIHEQYISQCSRKTPVAKDPDSEKSTPFTSMVGSPGSIYQPGWGVTKNCHLDTSDVCQDVVDHIVPPGKAIAQVARQEQRIEAREKHIKNLEALLEAEADMKRATEAKNVELAKELESLRVQFSDLQVSNNQLSQQVSTLQAQIMSEERIKATFKEFKKYEDDRVNSRCVEIDARLDALSIDFNEELYPHMLTSIAGHQWVIEHGLCLVVMKCAESTKLRQVFADVVSARIAKGMSEGLKHGVEHRKAKVDLADIEAYDPEADTKYVVALHALKDVKYPLVDQLEKLKDAPIDVIMASLFLESDSGEDAPQWIRELHPSSSQLKILVYPEVRNPKDPWSFKEDILSNGVSVSVPTIAPQGLAILLADAATQTEITKDEASPRLLRSKSLPLMYNLDWP